MRRVIGISFACLVISTSAIGKTPEKSAPHHPSETNVFSQGNEEGRTERAEQHCASFDPPAGACAGIPALYCRQLRTTGISQLRTTGISLFGKAAWYNLVGRQTSSGEILDTVTATAAHRSLPLASYAKVTNLDNGRWVVVKINDRGPYTRGRILDLSPRSADALDMKRAGVAAVAVEPLVNQAVPTVTVFSPVRWSVDDLGTST
jgi:rare lipoprotein A